MYAYVRVCVRASMDVHCQSPRGTVHRLPNTSSRGRALVPLYGRATDMRVRRVYRHVSARRPCHREPAVRLGRGPHPMRDLPAQARNVPSNVPSNAPSNVPSNVPKSAPSNVPLNGRIQCETCQLSQAQSITHSPSSSPLTVTHRHRRQYF